MDINIFNGLLVTHPIQYRYQTTNCWFHAYRTIQRDKNTGANQKEIQICGEMILMVMST